MNHFSMIQNTPSSYICELDGHRIYCRNVDIHVGMEEAPTVKIELLGDSRIEMDANVILQNDDFILDQIRKRFNEPGFCAKLAGIADEKMKHDAEIARKKMLEKPMETII